MKSNRPYLIALPALLVLGMLVLWVSASIDTRAANPVSFSSVEVEECFEEQLEEDACENLLVPSQGAPIPEVRRRCFQQFRCAVEFPSTDCPSGWIMPLRI